MYSEIYVITIAFVDDKCCFEWSGIQLEQRAETSEEHIKRIVSL